MPPNFRDILALLREDGWVQVGQKGSHRQFTHPTKPGRVTVAGHPGKVASIETWRSILRQAGLKR